MVEMESEILKNWGAVKKPDNHFDINKNESKLVLLEDRLKSVEESDDPLLLYLDLIEYVNGQRSEENQLIEVLTRCAHHFKDDELYRDDLRYLNVWFHYIHFSESPFEIYTYLFKKRIGSRSGIFYQKFADYLEQVNDYQKCYETYTYGISRTILRNLKSLMRNFEAFKLRLVNYQRLSGPIDKMKAPFLSEFAIAQSSDRGSRHSLEENQVSKRHRTMQLYPTDYQIVEIPGRPAEKWRLNLKMLYSESGEEFTPEEILCMSRGIYDFKSVSPLTPPIAKKGLRQRTVTTKVPLKDISETKLNRNELQLGPGSSEAPLNLTTNPEPNPDSPTMFTKEAQQEILSLFNLPFAVDKAVPDKKQDAAREKANFQIKRDDKEEVENMQAENGQVEDGPATPNNEDHNQENLGSEDTFPKNRGGAPHMMTPIPEVSENSTRVSEAMSSPFIEEPVELPGHEDVPPLVDPSAKPTKLAILRSSSSPLNLNADYEVYHSALGKKTVLELFFDRPTSGKRPAIGNKSTLLEFRNEMYCVTAKLGSNCYVGESSTGVLDLIKIVSPPDVWEYYILKLIGERCGCNFIVDLKSVNVFEDESFLVLEYLQQDNLSSLITKHKTKNESLDQRLIMLIMLELLDSVSKLHESLFIHGDLRPESVLFDIQTGGRRILKLCNFSKSIDTSQFPSGARFQSDEYSQLVKSLESASWTVEVDYLNLLSILHLLLFHEPIQIIQDENGKLHCTSKPLKTYWDRIWQELFDVLLIRKQGSLKGLVEKLQLKLNNCDQQSLIEQLQSQVASR